MRDLFPYFIVAALMGIAVHALELLNFPNHWSLLVAQISVGIAAYAGLCRLFRLTAFMDVWQAMVDRMPLVKADTSG